MSDTGSFLCKVWANNYYTQYIMAGKMSLNLTMAWVILSIKKIGTP